MLRRRLWLGLTISMFLGCQADDGEAEDTDAAEGTAGTTTAATSTPTSAPATTNPGPSSTSGPTTRTASTTTREGSSTEASSAESGSDESGSSTGEAPEAFHTCGSGGATGAWTVFEVPYPAGTTLADGSEVTTARYEVWAPTDAEGPLPLIVALHGDEGTLGATKSNWTHRLEDGDFILVTPQEPHQEVDGSGSDNGWDNHSNQTRAFLHAMFDDVGTRYDIDIDRVYATGASAGSWVGGQIFFTMQDIWAAVQFNCGGASGVGYTEPTDPACVTPARFEISPSDFLYSAAQTTAMFVEDRGHEVEFNDTACRGHCCGQREDYGDAAWEFFEPRVHCAALSRGGCGEIPTP